MIYGNIPLERKAAQAMRRIVKEQTGGVGQLFDIISVANGLGSTTSAYTEGILGEPEAPYTAVVNDPGFAPQKGHDGTGNSGRLDIRSLNSEQRASTGGKLMSTTPVAVTKNTISKSGGVSAMTAARQWRGEHVGNSGITFSTEIGDVRIDSRSIKDSLSHGFSQKKLDAISSLPVGFGKATYLGSMRDSTRVGDNHYFAYPIEYGGERHYVFCRALQDTNRNRFYVHEVFVAGQIESGTLQTAAPIERHGGSALYKAILSNVLSAGKDSSSAQEKQEIESGSSQAADGHPVREENAERHAVRAVVLKKINDSLKGGAKDRGRRVKAMRADQFFDQLEADYQREGMSAQEASERVEVFRNGEGYVYGYPAPLPPHWRQEPRGV